MPMNVNYSYLLEQMFGVSNTAKDVASGGIWLKCQIYQALPCSHS